MGRTLVIGDVHGCADELDQLLRRVRPTRTVLVGDLFTRGPDPRGVWDLIREWRAEAVLGNHDVDVLGRWKPGRELPRKAFRWLRRLPPWIETETTIIVHAAIHPEGLQRTSRKVAVGLREPKGGVPWYARWRGERLVVHGHDAKRGLDDRRPWSLALDTACVRGGRLTGYVVETDRLVSVPARRTWA